MKTHGVRDASRPPKPRGSPPGFGVRPLLRRFDSTRQMDHGRNLVVGLIMLGAKAVEDYRSPRRFAFAEAAEKSARSWTAPVLRRFDRAREMDYGRNLCLSGPHTRSNALSGALRQTRPTTLGCRPFHPPALRSLAAWTTLFLFLLGFPEPGRAQAEDTGAERILIEAGKFTEIFDPRAGETAPWCINDHTFVRGPDGQWHVFAHASEVVRDLDGKWFISHAGWERGGLSLAPLIWHDGLDRADTSLKPGGAR